MHNLDMSGGARFAYGDRQAPWHRLGVAMKPEDQTMDLMLAAARADFKVSVQKVIACDAHGYPLMNEVRREVLDEATGDVRYETEMEYVYVEDSRATVREDHDGTFTGLATVGTRYTATQNAEVLARALAIVNASETEVCVDTVGVLDAGRSFFACIRLEDLDLVSLDGTPDTIQRYLLVRTSHDGKTPIWFGQGDIRVVCQNTEQMFIKGAKSVFKSRHTKNSVDDLLNSEDVLRDAREALNVSVEWSKHLKRAAQELMGVDIKMAQVDKFLNELFPLDKDATDRQKVTQAAKVGTVKGLYGGETNAATFGENGWSLYNAVTEWADHYRDGTDVERARTSMNPDSWVGKLKVEAQQRILAMAN